MEACSELTAVVDNSSKPSLITARICRDEAGGIIEVDLETGYGMQIGNDDEAFPQDEPCSRYIHYLNIFDIWTNGSSASILDDLSFLMHANWLSRRELGLGGVFTKSVCS